jgi:hypothetical protein
LHLAQALHESGGSLESHGERHTFLLTASVLPGSKADVHMHVRSCMTCDYGFHEQSGWTDFLGTYAFPACGFTVQAVGLRCPRRRAASAPPVQKGISHTASDELLYRPSMTQDGDDDIDGEELRRDLEATALQIERGELKSVTFTDGAIERTFPLDTEEERDAALLTIRTILGQVH